MLIILKRNGAGVSFRRFVLTLMIGAALSTVNPLELLSGNSSNAFQLMSSAFAQGIPSPGEVAVNATMAYSDGSYSYVVTQDFGTPPDTGQAPTQSKVRIFENGTELGSAHSLHADISTVGMGRFSHWGGTNGTLAISNLYFSASDNTDPRQNGRMYTYRIDSAPAPTPTSHPAVTATLLGQTGEDVVGTWQAPPDGVKDVHIKLSGVSGTITSVRITGVGTDGVWQTPFNGYNWIVAIRPQSDPSFVDLYFDFYMPITSYNLTVSYSDGATQMVQTVPLTPAPLPVLTPPPPPANCSTGCFYVSPSGSDSDPGTQAAPWRTIQKAANTLVAGQTAVLLDGTYEEPEIYFKQSGTAAQPITVMAQHKWAAVVSTISNCNPSMSLYADSIVVQDLYFTVSPNDVQCTVPGRTAMYTIYAWAGYTGAIIRGVKIDYSTHRYGAIKLSQNLSLVENSVLNDGVETFNTNGAIVRNNVFSGGGPDSGFIIFKGGSRNTHATGNVIHVQYGVWGILLGGSSGAQWTADPVTGTECFNCVASNNVVINETANTVPLLGMRGAKDSAFVNNVAIGGSLYMWLGGADPGPRPSNANPVWKNNIVVGRGGSATGSWSGFFTGTLALDYNNFYNFTSGVPGQSHAIVGDPQFVDPSSDWHLQPGSCAVGAGVEVNVPGVNGESIDVSRDKDGNIRTAPWNLGIY